MSYEYVLVTLVKHLGSFKPVEIDRFQTHEECMAVKDKMDKSKPNTINYCTLRRTNDVAV